LAYKEGEQNTICVVGRFVSSAEHSFGLQKMMTCEVQQRNTVNELENVREQLTDVEGL
jgi:hypothetical protein